MIGHYEAELVGKYQMIMDAIPEGMDYAISQRALARHCNMTERELRAVIQRARTEGLFICSGDCGYYLPETEEELRRHFRRARARLKSGQDALLPVTQYLMNSAEGLR